MPTYHGTRGRKQNEVRPSPRIAALQLIKFFQGFEVEHLLGSQFGYYVYSTLIYQMVYVDPDPQYANAVVLNSITLIAIAAIIPLQRWIVHRKQYTTVASAWAASCCGWASSRRNPFGPPIIGAMC